MSSRCVEVHWAALHRSGRVKECLSVAIIGLFV